LDYNTSEFISDTADKEKEISTRCEASFIVYGAYGVVVTRLSVAE
jgi:hypothetical protein